MLFRCLLQEVDSISFMVYIAGLGTSCTTGNAVCSQSAWSAGHAIHTANKIPEAADIAYEANVSRSCGYPTYFPG